MEFWYKPRLSLKAILLYPLSRLYRHFAYKKYAKDVALASAAKAAGTKLQVPVIVVGNITVGGTGKTPMVRFLFRYLHALGFKVGVISRGYGGKYRGIHHVTAEDTAATVGDEIAMQFAYCQRQGLDNIEFVVAKERTLAALKAQELGCNFIIADDGLQHYRLPRHLEIVVVGPQGLGNKQFLPAGPLREDPKRLRSADFIINNSKDTNLGGYRMEQAYLGFMQVKDIKQPMHLAQSIDEVLLAWHDFLREHLPMQLVQWQEYLKLHTQFKPELAIKYFGLTLDTNHLYLEKKLQAACPNTVQNHTTSLNSTQTAVQEPLALTTISNTQSNTNQQLNVAAATAKQDPIILAQQVGNLPQVTLTPQSLTPTHQSITFDSQAATFPLNLRKEKAGNYSTLKAHSLVNSSTKQQALANKAQNKLENSYQEQDHAYTKPSQLDPNLAARIAKAPEAFTSVEQFLEFIDKQIDHGILSYKYLKAKAQSLITTQHIFVEAMQATFPKVIALCAIGYPQGFRQTLESLGFEVVELFAFPDHHQFKQSDIDKIYNENPEYAEYPLLVTEKDAIKLQHLELKLLTFFLEREGYFKEHSRWLENLKNKLISIYTSGIQITTTTNNATTANSTTNVANSTANSMTSTPNATTNTTHSSAAPTTNSTTIAAANSIADNTFNSTSSTAKSATNISEYTATDTTSNANTNPDVTTNQTNN